MVHRGKQVVQEMIPKGGGRDEQRPLLSPDVPDRVHLLQSPIPAGQGPVAHVVEVRVTMGGDQGGEGHPVAGAAVDHQQQQEAPRCREAGREMQQGQVEGWHEVKGTQGAIANQDEAELE